MLSGSIGVIIAGVLLNNNGSVISIIIGLVLIVLVMNIFASKERD